MKPLSLLLPAAFIALAIVPAGGASALGERYCYWNPDFVDLVLEVTLGMVHLHDGPICTAHLHRPTSLATDQYCMWEPGFAQLVYDATLGTVHLHDGRICTVHLH